MRSTWSSLPTHTSPFADVTERASAARCAGVTACGRPTASVTRSDVSSRTRRATSSKKRPGRMSAVACSVSTPATSSVPTILPLRSQRSGRMKNMPAVFARPLSSAIAGAWIFAVIGAGSL